MEKHLLIDGNAIMHRAYHAIPNTMTSLDGTPTNAIFGFFTMLQKVIKQYSPDYLTICFDTPVPSFRKKLLNSYQANRPKSNEEFKKQIPIIHNLLDRARITRIEKSGYEADDIIGTLSKKNKR